MPTPMTIHVAHITKQISAQCPKCKTICIYWDNEDLDDNGNLLCTCDQPTT